MNENSEVRAIPLAKGKEAIVDAADYSWLSQFKWCYSRGYAARGIRINGRATTQRMHRLILNAQPEEFVDHADRNTLNNSRSNIRICTKAQNAQNAKLRSDNTSGSKGVYFDRRHLKWVAEIRANGQSISLGRFSDKQAATDAYDVAAVQLFGAFARPNSESPIVATVDLRKARLRPQNKSGFRGVSFEQRGQQWKTMIQVNNRLIWLGYFDAAEAAALAYDQAAIEHLGHKAKLNFPELFPLVAQVDPSTPATREDGYAKAEEVTF